MGEQAANSGNLTVLQDWVTSRHRVLRKGVASKFQEKQNIKNFQDLFLMRLRHYFPLLTVPWGVKHTGPINTLLKTYTADQIEDLITEALRDFPAYFPHGITFERFYSAVPQLALAVSLRQKKAAAMKQRAKERRKKEKAEPILEIQQSWIDKLPPIFKEKTEAFLAKKPD